ncbi:hypothetical protein CSC12_3587 [Klebsiella michiganensis]|nr:hypothetical protein CSC12_3587 [Klebsiella michiganensis]
MSGQNLVLLFTPLLLIFILNDLCSARVVSRWPPDINLVCNKGK